MAQRIFSVGSFSYYNPPFGDDGWVGSAANLGDSNDGSFIEAYTGDTEPDRRAGVSVSDDSSVPTNISSISNVTVRYRAASSSGDQPGPGIISGTALLGVTFQEGSSGGPAGTSFADTDVAFSLSSAGVAWTRARVFQEVYYGQSQHVVNGGGTTYWSEIRVILNFTLAAPTATTDSASNITPTTADLGGTVNPNGSTSTFDTEYYFEYGLTSSYGSTTAVTGGLTGSGGQSVTKSISGLTPGTIYHFRIVARNDDNTVNGADQTFTTISTDDVLMVL